MANKFLYKSFIKDVEKELLKSEKRQLRKAANIYKKKIIEKIVAKGLVEDGNLIEGVQSTVYQHAALVGMAPPAYHALIVELGSYITGERFTKGKGSKRSKVRSTGVMRARPYFLPASRNATPAMISKMSEEW